MFWIIRLWAYISFLLQLLLIFISSISFGGVLHDNETWNWVNLVLLVCCWPWEAVILNWLLLLRSSKHSLSISLLILHLYHIIVVVRSWKQSLLSNFILGLVWSMWNTVSVGSFSEVHWPISVRARDILWQVDEFSCRCSEGCSRYGLCVSLIYSN